jgi:hypothetical protein
VLDWESHLELKLLRRETCALLDGAPGP